MDSKCIFQLNKKGTAPSTRVRIMPETHARLAKLCSLTGETFQDATDRLMRFALDHVELYDEKSKLEIEV